MIQRKPRIAVVSPFLDKQHGTERCVAEQIERLADDYEFHVYSMQVRDMDTHSIIWHRIPAIPGPHLFKYIWFFCANHVWRWRGRVLSKIDFDLTYSPGINCFDAELIAVHIVFANVFERVYRGSNGDGNESGSWFRIAHRKAFYRLIIWLERRIYTHKTLPLIVVSQKVQNDLERFYGRRNQSFVVYNGIEPVQFNPQVRESHRCQARNSLGYVNSDFVLLLIGNDWKTKGLICLLEAVALLGRCQLKVAVVGEDDVLSFRASLDSKNLVSSVQFLPLRSDPEFYYAAADVYVGPSLEDAFGIPPLEAMSCGVPAIVSKQSGVSELITHGEDGYILEDSERPKDLASFIAKLHDDVDLRQSMGHRAAETAGRYTWKRNADRFHEILMAVLAQKQGTRPFSPEKEDCQTS